MTLEELEALCVEAARDLVARSAGRVPATVVLPGPEATAVTALPDFPDDDIERFDLLSRFAADRIRPAGVPCYGFVAEAALDSGGSSDDVLVVVYGARRHQPRVMAAPLLRADGAGGSAPARDIGTPQPAAVEAAAALGPFTASEPLDPTAMPFLGPLQHAVDAAEPPDVTGGVLPT